MKILIAEDDSLILKTLQLCLKKDGNEVIACIDGLDAMEKIKEQEPDIIIVDIMLPYLSGLEIVGKVKQELDPIPVIVISAMGQQSVVEEAMRLGADDYISKPFNINTLNSLLAKFSARAMVA